MSSIALGSATAGLLDREVTVAKSGFNRWLVPPAALAIHLCIGMAYGFSVFWVPLGKVISLATGAAKPVACAGDRARSPCRAWYSHQGTGHLAFHRVSLFVPETAQKSQVPRGAA